jgi:predicted O-linked N-acetylglucosamine transferase (SPINDLY family)
MDAQEYNNQGVAHAGRQEIIAAIDCFDHALALRPLYVDALSNRGILLESLRLHEKAFADLRLAVKLTYNDYELHNSLAKTLHQLWRLEEALFHCEKCLAIKPDHINAHIIRGNILQSLKRYDEAIRAYNEALSLDPHCASAASNIVFTSDLMELGFAEQQRIRREWYQSQVSRIEPILGHHNDRSYDRPLVVGYLSADFRDHSAAYGIRPILQNHNHDRFKIVCYAGMTIEDEITQEMQRYADIWRRVNKHSDEQLVQQILSDKIDILVDLAGHTADQRLAVFARRPSPIQVTGWGYATGTGCPFIDYLFSDSILIPTSVRHLYTEEIIDLPCALPYAPRPATPEVAPLPYDRNGYITFGQYNREAKISSKALELWGWILSTIPDSRIIFKESAFENPRRREPILRVLKNYVDLNRIIFRAKDQYWEHMQSFDQIDIALDTFPHNGGVSTWEPLWMGVPVVAKMGDSHPSRISAAILTAIGLSEWIAADDDGYVKLAISAANNVAALRDFRSSIRKRLAKSHAGNPTLYIKDVEAAYRNIWRKWCNDTRRGAEFINRGTSSANLRTASRA